MTINLKLQLTEDQLRRVRAWYKRGGRATRNECRVWLNRVIADATQALPEPKVRRKPAGPFVPQHVTRARTAYEEAKAAPDHARCLKCGHRKDEHGLMSFACPPPARWTFVPDPDGNSEESDGNSEPLRAVISDTYERCSLDSVGARR